MRRTRRQIEAEITALQAELAAVQLEILEFGSDWVGGGRFRFHVVDRAIEFSKLADGTRLYKYVGLAEFESLRDWLNYHFPKENA